MKLISCQRNTDETEGERRGRGDEGTGPEELSSPIPLWASSSSGSAGPRGSPLRQSPPGRAAPPRGGWGRAVRGHALLPALRIAEGRDFFNTVAFSRNIMGKVRTKRLPGRRHLTNAFYPSAYLHLVTAPMQMESMYAVCTSCYECLHAHLKISCN